MTGAGTGTPDPAAIAAGLTVAQRKEILSFTEPWPVRLMHQTEADALPVGLLMYRTNEPGRSYRSYRLSRLGLAVRALLQLQDGLA